jgi:hypothetical protein
MLGSQQIALRKCLAQESYPSYARRLFDTKSPMLFACSRDRCSLNGRQTRAIFKGGFENHFYRNCV